MIAISVPSVAAVSDAVPVTVSVKNFGTSATTSPFVVDFVALPAAASQVPTAAAPCGRVEAPNLLAPGATIELHGRAQLALAPGQARVGAVADPENAVPESDETDNSAVSTDTVTLVAAAANLVVDTELPPIAADLGDTVPITVTVRNAGTGPARFISQIAVVLSTDPVIGGDDLALQSSLDIPPLGPGASRTLPVTVNFPSGLPSGRYYLGAIADQYGYIAETDERDNFRSIARLDLTTSRVDLQVDRVAAPGTVRIGRPFEVGTILSGHGSLPVATPFKVSVQVRLEASGPPTELGSVVVQSLAAGATLPLTLPCLAEGALAPGSYELTVFADSDSAIGEIDETNNRLAAGARVTVLPSDVDVTIAAVRIPGAATIGAPLRARLSVTNRGTGTTQRFFYAAAFLSADGRIDADIDAPMGERYIDSLAAGQTTTFELEGRLPTALATGTYSYLAVADRDNVLIESNESNNVLTSSLSVRRSRVDLAVQQVVAPPAATPREFLPFYVQVANSGSEDAPPFQIQFYASTTAELTLQSIQLGGDFDSRGGLSRGESRLEGPYFAAVPEGLAAGSYYLLARLDPYEQVDQLSRTNDVLAAPARIGVTTQPASVDDHPDLPELTAAPRDALPTDGTPVAAQHERPRDVDFFQFSAKTGDQLLAAVFGQPGSSVDTTLELLGPDGRRLAYDDSFGDATQSRVGPVTAPVSGTYRIAVRESQTFGRGAYVVRVWAQAGRPELAVTLSAPDPASVEQGTRVRTTMTVTNLGRAIALAGVKARLYASQDTNVTTADTLLAQLELPDLAAGASVGRPLELLLDRYEVPPGPYTLGAILDTSALPQAGNGTSVTTAAPGRVTVLAAEDDHPGKAALVRNPADDLGSGGFPIVGRIERAGDEDFFRFDVQNGGDYLVETRPGTLALRRCAVFIDSEQNRVNEDDAGGEAAPTRIAFHADHDGVAFVRVAARDPLDTGTYAAVVTRLPEGSLDDYPDTADSGAPNVPLQNTQTGLIGQPGDKDVVQLRLTRAVQYRLSVSPVTLTTVRVDLLDPDRRSVRPQAVSSGPGQSVLFEFTANRTGSYFVVIQGGSPRDRGSWLLVYDFLHLPSVDVTEERTGSRLLVHVDVADLPVAIQAMQLPLQFEGAGLFYTGEARPGPAAAGLDLTVGGGADLGFLGLSFAADALQDPVRAPRDGRLVTLVFNVVDASKYQPDRFGTGNVDILDPLDEAFSMQVPEANPGVGQSVQLRLSGQGRVLPTLVDPLDPSGPRVDYVRLDGRSSSDPGPFPSELTYHWTVTTSPVPVTLSRPATPAPTFAPAVPGFYRFGLRVFGGGLSSALQTVDVEVGIAEASPSALPVAVELSSRRTSSPENPVLQVRAGAGGVRLDGTGSFDPNPADQGALTYQWMQVDGPAVVLTPSPAEAAPTFAPTRPGLYGFTLVVQDPGGLQSQAETLQVLATPGAAVSPLEVTAQASTDDGIGQALPLSRVDVTDRSLRVSLPTTVSLRAALAARPTTGSTGAVEFFWQQVEGPPVSLTNALDVVDSALFSTTRFEPTTARVYEFDCLMKELDPAGEPTGVELGRRVRVVVDGPDNSVPVSVALPREPAAKRLPAAAAADATASVPSGAQVVLDGSRSSDPGPGFGRRLTYQWTQLAGPPVVISNPFAAVTTFVAPVFTDRSRPLVFALFVDDGAARSAPALAVVDVQGKNQPSGGIELASGANLIGVPVVPDSGGYTAANLGTDTRASLVVRLAPGPGGPRFQSFLPGSGSGGFGIEGNQGYILLTTAAPGRTTFAGGAWDQRFLQRRLDVGLNLISMPRGVPAAFTVQSLATLSGARFVAYTAQVGGRARTLVYLPGLTATAPAVEAGKAYLLSVPASADVSLPAK
ncbi:MAG: pre-peptidase C-terminal domain-containing protein [Candidatus Wallbacteria bacterium]|nr:pre-peptidase C-terminal domain-containing protein [Candidatus Wallbacteria bacterium]